MKSKLQTAFDWLTARPLLCLALAVALFFAIYLAFLGVSSWWFERGVERHREVQTEYREHVNEVEREAITANAQGDLKLDEAERSEEQLSEIKKTVKDKKDNAKKKSIEADAAGRADVDDGDPDLRNERLCARANALGVRCDFDQ